MPESLPSTSVRVRYPRWRCTVAERKRMVNAIFELSDAARRVLAPDAQPSATQQLSAALANADALIDELGKRYYTPIEEAQ